MTRKNYIIEKYASRAFEKLNIDNTIRGRDFIRYLIWEMANSNFDDIVRYGKPVSKANVMKKTIVANLSYAVDYCKNNHYLQAQLQLADRLAFYKEAKKMSVITRLEHW